MDFTCICKQQCKQFSEITKSVFIYPFILTYIDCSKDNPPETLLESYRALRGELQEFSADLAKKKELIALTKCELVSEEELKAAKSVFHKEGLEPIAISAAANIGIDQLLDKLVQLLDFNEEF